ncbi:MAG: M20 family metallo-hydrolase [bacterium]
MGTVQVDEALVWERLEQLSGIGRHDDDAGGITRLALGPADVAGRRLVESWMLDAGCSVTHDGIGNTFGVLAGRDPDLAPVVMGSHLDTVVEAGRFDGCLGVVGAVEVLRAATGGDRPSRSLVAAVFTDEEGLRFGRDLLGSSVACGLLAPDAALGAADADGVTVAAELAASGMIGDHPWLRDAPPYTYLETHVEQGPRLLGADLPVGCVTGVVGTSWLEITIAGVASHAGATPMDMRRDAGLALADLRLALDALASERPEITLAAGAMAVRPGVTNVVPGQATMTVDVRSGDGRLLDAAEDEIQRVAHESAARRGCHVARCTRLSRTEPVAFDPALTEAVAERIAAHGVPVMKLWSGAGHDAQQLATVCPATMVFVRSRNDGVSHSPAEWSTAGDCALGVQVMADVALRYAT